MKLAKAGRAARGEGAGLPGWLGGARGRLVGDGDASVGAARGTLSADAAPAARPGATAGEVRNYFGGP